MRKLEFDEYEFESPSSEEFLRIATAPKRQYLDLVSFLVACGWTENNIGQQLQNIRPVRLYEFKNYFSVTTYLKQFAGMEINDARDCQIHVIQSEWNLVKVIVETVGDFILYHWETSA